MTPSGPDDPDAIFKPGYAGPPPTPSSVTSPTAGADEQSPEPADREGATRPRRSRRRWFGVATALGLVLVGAIVVLDRRDSGNDPDPDPDAAADTPEITSPDPSVFGGPAARRLPLDAATLWSIDIAADGDHWIDVVGRDLVIAVVEPTATPIDSDGAAPPATTVGALDALSGQQRWTRRVDALPRDVQLVGAVDDVLVLEQRDPSGPTLTGVDIATGETRWSTDPVADTGHVALVGTQFVARLPPPPDRLVALIDASSGQEVATIASDPTAGGRPGGWFTDRRGTWFVAADGEITAYDLSSGVGEPTAVASVDEVSVPPIAVGERIATVDDAGTITLAGADEPTSVAVSADVPGAIRTLTPVSDSDFVVTAPGSVAGISVEGDTADVSWSRRAGVLADHHPVDDGTLLQLATRGGGALELVDGRTGETLEQLTMAPGVLQSLVVAGDGVVVLRSALLGTRLVGIDLDGTERWSILGSTPVVVGDRIAVRATTNRAAVDENTDSSSPQLRITAYGDAD